MKYLLLVALLAGTASVAYAKTCEECPPIEDSWRPRGSCAIWVPAGDGCNTCLTATYCIEGKWYQDDMMRCTLLACQGNRIELPGNPTEPPLREELERAK